jgi:hypothetical protein
VPRSDLSAGLARSGRGPARSSGRDPTNAGRLGGLGHPGSSPTFDETRGPLVRRPPPSRDGALGPEGACRRPGSDARTAAAVGRGSGATTPHSAGRPDRGRQSLWAPHRAGGHPRLLAGPARLSVERRLPTPVAVVSGRRAERPAAPRQPQRRSAPDQLAASSASKIRLAPGISPGCVVSCVQRMERSVPTSTKLRFAEPRSSLKLPYARDI